VDGGWVIKPAELPFARVRAASVCVDSVYVDELAMANVNL
jgi:hypothetical protein